MVRRLIFIKPLMVISMMALVGCDTQTERDLEAFSYCVDEGRFLTDSEIYHAAIFEILDGVQSGHLKVADQYKDAFSQSSVGAFYEKNPHCCVVAIHPDQRRKIGGSDSNSRRASRKIYGGPVHFIGINFESDGGNFHTTARVRPCGELASTRLNVQPSGSTKKDRRDSGWPDRSEVGASARE